jgi:hypothetical protein
LQFLNFPQLRECSIEWRPKASSLFGLSGLNLLFINRFSGKDLTQFSNMTALTSLTLLNPSLHSLDGINALSTLDYLRIGRARKLTTIDGLQALIRLSRLELDESRKFHDIAPIGSLHQLRVLMLCDDGDLATLKPLERLLRLEEFYFTESTNVLDGDLSVLQRLPNLRKLAFQERPHYSLGRADFRSLSGV